MATKYRADQVGSFLRPPELLAARWTDFDFQRALWLQPQSAAPGTWVKPRPRRIALSDAALVLLRGMRERAPTDEHLFPSASNDGLDGRVESAWNAAVAAAAIDDAQLQKLRPVLASGVFKGLSDSLLKRLLGVAPSARSQAV